QGRTPTGRRATRTSSNSGGDPGATCDLRRDLQHYATLGASRACGWAAHAGGDTRLGPWVRAGAGRAAAGAAPPTGRADGQPGGVCQRAAVLSLCRAGSRAQARLDLARRWEAPPRAPAGVARPIYLPRRATWEADSCGRPSSAAVSHNL